MRVQLLGFRSPSVLIIIVLTIFNDNILDLLKVTAGLRLEVKYLIPLFGVLTSLIFYSNIIWSALKGVGRFDLANYIYAICSLIQVIISIILVVLGLGVWGLFLGNSILYIFLFILCFLKLKKEFKLRLFKINYFDISKVKKLTKFGGTMFGSRVIAMLLDPFNRIIIARFIGLSTVTYYDISLKVISSLRGFFEMGLRTTMPRVSELNSGSVNPKLEISNIHRKGMRFIVFFALPLFVLMFLFGKPVLNLWLGNNYNISILISLRIFLVAYFINLLCVPAYYIFMGLGKVSVCFYNIMIQSLINISFVLFIVLFLGKINLIELVSISGISIIISAVYVLIKYRMFKIGLIRREKC